MITTAVRPEIRELHFAVRGTGVWTVEEDAPELEVEFVWGRGSCPHCGHSVGRVEVALNQHGEPFTTVMHCPASISSPWPHPCGRPMLLVPDMDEED